MDPDARRTRIAVSAAFAAQGLGFAVLLSHVPAFKDRYDINDGVVTAVLFGVALLAGFGHLRGRTGRRAARQRAGAAAWPWSRSRSASPSSRSLRICPSSSRGSRSTASPSVRWTPRRTCKRSHCEFRYGRSILTSFHAAWSAGGIVGALYASATEALDLPLTGVLLVAAAAILAVPLVEGLPPGAGDQRTRPAGERRGPVGAGAVAADPAAGRGHRVLLRRRLGHLNLECGLPARGARHLQECCGAGPGGLPDHLAGLAAGR